MTRAPAGFALACVLALSAGCKDSTPNYIGFDAATATDAKTDVPPSSNTDGGGDGTVRGDAAPDASTADSGAIDAVADAAPGDDLTDGGSADGTTADSTTADGDASETEPGQ